MCYNIKIKKNSPTKHPSVFDLLGPVRSLATWPPACKFPSLSCICPYAHRFRFFAVWLPRARAGDSGQRKAWVWIEPGYRMQNQTQKDLGRALMLQHNQTSCLMHMWPGRGWPKPGSPSRLRRVQKSNTCKGLFGCTRFHLGPE